MDLLKAREFSSCKFGMSDMINLFMRFNKFTLQLIICLLYTCMFLFISLNFSLIFTVEAGTIAKIPFPSEIVISYLDGANKSLAEGNTSKTISDLFTVQRILSQNNDDSLLTKEAKILVRDTIKAVANGKIDIAMLNLNLIYQQLETPILSNETTMPIKRMENETTVNVQNLPSNKTSITVRNKTFEIPRLIEKSPSESETTLPTNESSSIVYDDMGIKYLTYDNQLFGIKIQYPESWTLRSYNYNKGGNNTVVGFFSPSGPASNLGYNSSIARQFLPYFDIFVYDSKNMSLESVIKGSVDRIRNHTYSEIVESKPYILKGNLIAQLIVHSATTVGEDELYKRMQIYALFNGKVYLLTFTSQEESFSNYLPVIKNMIDSFEILKRFGDICPNGTMEC